MRMRNGSRAIRQLKQPDGLFLFFTGHYNYKCDHRMKRVWVQIFFFWVILFSGYPTDKCRIKIFPDSVLNIISNYPIGINVNFFMDDDEYLKPSVQSTADGLKQLGVRFLRYPGGEKSDFYRFARPPYEKVDPNPTRIGENCYFNYKEYHVVKNDSVFAWNVLDFDEFIALCREVGAEPIVVVAADMYLSDVGDGCRCANREELIAHAAAWVKYANRQKGYGVKYWMVGNECWHTTNPVGNYPSVYANDVISFSKAMKAVDPSIQIVANGFGEEWWEKLFDIAGGYFDLLCVSNYLERLYGGYQTYADSVVLFTPQTDIAIRAIEERGHDMKVIASEFAPLEWSGNWDPRNDMGHALANFEMQCRLLQKPRLHSALYWNTRWLTVRDDPNHIYHALSASGQLNPCGMSMALLSQNHGNEMIACRSDRFRVRAYASKKGNEFYLYLINTSGKDVDVEMEIPGYRLPEVTSAIRYSGNSPEDLAPALENGIRVSRKNAELPPYSLTIVRGRVRKNEGK